MSKNKLHLYVMQTELKKIDDQILPLKMFASPSQLLHKAQNDMVCSFILTMYYDFLAYNILIYCFTFYVK